MKVLVTGGAGFIGSHVIEELVRNGYEVVSVDNYITGFPENVPAEVKQYEMDINDKGLKLIFENEKPDYVIHLAAQASVMESMNDPFTDFFTNTAGTVNVVHLSQKHHVKKFIFASTAAVYGEPEYLPVDEKHNVYTKSFYALSKLSAENYIKQYMSNYQMDSCIFRFANVYGPRQNANGEAGVVALFTNGLLSNGEVSIFGGSQTRDFIYVKDIARACVCALLSSATGEYNISSGIETKITDLFFTIAQLSARNAEPVFMAERTGEIQRSVLDNRRAEWELQWQPQYELTDGLRETVQYYSNLLSFELQRR